jgi:hypothetical protein
MSAVFQAVPTALCGVTWSVTPNPALPSGQSLSSKPGWFQSDAGVAVM